jgi:hypothetical protein
MDPEDVNDPEALGGVAAFLPLWVGSVLLFEPEPGSLPR